MVRERAVRFEIQPVQFSVDPIEDLGKNGSCHAVASVGNDRQSRYFGCAGR